MQWAATLAESHVHGGHQLIYVITLVLLTVVFMWMWIGVIWKMMLKKLKKRRGRASYALEYILPSVEYGGTFEFTTVAILGAVNR